MSIAEKRHLQRIADWAEGAGCVVCGEPFAHLHHILEDRTPGRKPSGWLCIPLCGTCHLGDGGIHDTRDRWKLRKMSETKALEITLEALYGEIK